MMEPRRNPEAHTCSFLRGHYLGLLASSARVKKYMKNEEGKREKISITIHAFLCKNIFFYHSLLYLGLLASSATVKKNGIKIPIPIIT